MKLNTETEQFFTAIEPLSGGDGDITFNYLALRVGDRHIIFRGRLYFNNSKTAVPFTHYETTRIKAGQYHLKDLAMSARELAAELAKGLVKTPHGELHFPLDSMGNTHINFHPYHEEGLANQNRLNILNISTPGVRFDPVELDWELKAAPTPFDSLLDLSSLYALGPVMDQLSIVEFVAPNVIAVDRESRVVGSKSEIRVRLMSGLATDKVSVGYRVLSNREVADRGSIKGSAMSWKAQDGVQSGIAELDVPNAAVVQCIACYNGIAQSTYWIADNTNFQNPRRTAYEAFDAGLSTLKDFLQLGPGTARGKPQQDLEVGISWLLWMLGFSTAHLGATPRTQDAADLIVATPNGSMAVVECTLGLLKSDNKLPNVVKRTEEVKERLKKSNNHHLQVIPVIVSSLSREKISADIEQAEKLGVLVLSSENLLEGINRSMLIPNADQYYREAMEVIRAGQEKHRPRATGTNGN